MNLLFFFTLFIVILQKYNINSTKTKQKIEVLILYKYKIISTYKIYMNIKYE